MYSWQYNPLSRTNGNFVKAKPELATKKVLANHEFTSKLKESGYSVNHYTCDSTGWIPDKCLNSDMKRTEYRIRYNTKKDFHYKGALFSTGILKKKEQVYKHT